MLAGHCIKEHDCVLGYKLQATGAVVAPGRLFFGASVRDCRTDEWRAAHAEEHAAIVAAVQAATRPSDHYVTEEVRGRTTRRMAGWKDLKRPPGGLTAGNPNNFCACAVLLLVRMTNRDANTRRSPLQPLQTTFAQVVLPEWMRAVAGGPNTTLRWVGVGAQHHPQVGGGGGLTSPSGGGSGWRLARAGTAGPRLSARELLAWTVT